MSMTEITLQIEQTDEALQSYSKEKSNHDAWCMDHGSLYNSLPPQKFSHLKKLY